ncbi:hypothetical protein Tsubulata_044319, partial [Turnera subulata]
TIRHCRRFSPPLLPFHLPLFVTRRLRLWSSGRDNQGAGSLAPSLLLPDACNTPPHAVAARSPSLPLSSCRLSSHIVADNGVVWFGGVPLTGVWSWVWRWC